MLANAFSRTKKFISDNLLLLIHQIFCTIFFFLQDKMGGEKKKEGFKLKFGGFIVLTEGWGVLSFCLKFI